MNDPDVKRSVNTQINIVIQSSSGLTYTFSFNANTEEDAFKMLKKDLIEIISRINIKKLDGGTDNTK